MSHTIKATDVRLAPESVLQAAQKLGYKTEVGKVRLFDRTEVEGLAVSLPGWSYPLVVQPDGALVYDNYKGRWGNIEELEKLAAYSMAAMAGTAWPELIREADGTHAWVMETN